MQNNDVIQASCWRGEYFYIFVNGVFLLFEQIWISKPTDASYQVWFKFAHWLLEDLFMKKDGRLTLRHIIRQGEQNKIGILKCKICKQKFKMNA